MIYTLTTNPAIDMNIKSRDVQPSIVNRTESVKYSPNGKGVNVSLVLKHYGINSKILGFFGGFTGKFIIDEMNTAGFETRPIWIDEPTRINIFLNDGKYEYKFVNKGSFIPKQEQDALIELISNLSDCNYLIISGSLPQGVEDSYYDEIFEACRKISADVIIDISSNKLKELLKYKPLLIKPNDEEIKDIFGITITNESDVKTTLMKLHEMGARNILLTMGAKGMYFYNGKKAYYCDAPKVKLMSSACAGDSSLAAFLSEWIPGGDLEKALKKSSATGANVAESEGLGELDKVDEYMKKLNVREVI